jgi:hypothetical protein
MRKALSWGGRRVQQADSDVRMVVFRWTKALALFNIEVKDLGDGLLDARHERCGEVG